MPGFSPVSKGADIRKILTRLGDPTGQTLATVVTKLGDPSTALGALLEDSTYGLALLARAAILNVMEHEIEFPSAEALNDISVTGEQPTTERTITVTLPTGASIRRVLLVAVITAMNNFAQAQKIDVTVQGRKGAGSWSDFFSEDDCFGFGAIDGATASLVAVQDVSALVDAAASYGFRLSVNQSATQSVRYTTQFLLVITYRMS